MKKISFILLCVLITQTSFAQLQTGHHYKLKSEMPDTIFYTPDKGKTLIPVHISNKADKLNGSVLQDEKNPAILRIDFWQITKEDTLKIFGATDNSRINSSMKLDTSHYFFMRIPDRTTVGSPTYYISLPYTTWEFGVTTIPFKYRFGAKGDSIPNDATTGVSGGLYFGRKWGHTRYFQNKLRTANSGSVAFAGFVSPTVIALTSENTKNKTTMKSNELGLGYGLAFMLSYSDINIGFLVGIDSPLSKESNQWFYANKPWIGFGIGYKLAFLNGGK